MSCKQWTLATATFLLLILSLWSFINAILLCTNKYLLSDFYVLMSHQHRDSPIQVIRTTTQNTITVVNTSLFVY